MRSGKNSRPVIVAAFSGGRCISTPLGASRCSSGLTPRTAANNVDTGGNTATCAATACGTPCWTAPEVLRAQRYCASADVYSFGIIAWECVTRADPYGVMPPFQVIFAVGTQGARPPIPRDCPPELSALIQACWHEQPDERPTFKEVAERIGGIMAILCTGEALPPTRLRHSRVSSLTNSGLEMADNAADEHGTDEASDSLGAVLPFKSDGEHDAAHDDDNNEHGSLLGHKSNKKSKRRFD